MRFYKTLILISFLVIVLLVILLLQLFNKPTTNPSTEPSQQITPKAPVPVSITNINLSDDPILVGQPIIIDFSGTISKDSLKITVFPEEELKIQLDNSLKKLIVETTAGIWKYNESYTLDISSQSIDKKYQYLFKTRPYSGI